MKKECIILAGGLGTRLQNVVANLPKCMANIAGKTFLHYLLKYLESYQFEHIVLSLGYKHEVVKEWIKAQNLQCKISYMVETEPLGTGGAIKFATQALDGNITLVINGDTLFRVDLAKFYDSHNKSATNLSMALKPMKNFERYGNVEINEKLEITQFREKTFCQNGLINGGIYLLNKEIFIEWPKKKFSFENDFMPGYIKNNAVQAYIEDAYFLDIGIPEDYEKAQTEFIQFA